MTRGRGFTLIELMIVVAIIGLLSAIAIPKFADMIRKSKQGSSKGSLGMLRSALSIYYGDNEGFFPSGPKSSNSTILSANLVTKYIQAFPTLRGTQHSDTTRVYAHNTSEGHSHDTGQWMYDGNDTGDADWGKLWVACTHTDGRGQVWSQY